MKGYVNHEVQLTLASFSGEGQTLYADNVTLVSMKGYVNHEVQLTLASFSGERGRDSLSWPIPLDHVFPYGRIKGMSRGKAITSKNLGMVEEHSLNGNKRVCATKQGMAFEVLKLPRVLNFTLI